MANPQTTVTSKQFTLNWADLGKGFLVAAITAALSSIVAILTNGVFPTGAELKVAAIAGLTAGIAYLLKNFFTTSEVTIKNATPAEVNAVKEGEAKVEIKPT